MCSLQPVSFLTLALAVFLAALLHGCGGGGNDGGGACESNSDVTVSIELGHIIGKCTTMKDGGLVKLFRGVPFALPPTGERRWAAPNTSLPKFMKPLQALEFGRSCPNVNMTQVGHLCTTCSSRNNFPEWPNSEDCLYLNIMTPPDSNSNSGLAVAVFVHGGGSTVGWAGPYTNTSTMARQGLIYVTTQYRLASLGFLSFPELGLDGNYATLDLVAGLQWVQRHIKGFGGDAGRVMVFGQSAGAQMVQTLLLTPLAAGLFHGAILESSGSVSNYTTGSVPSVSVSTFLESIGCNGTGNTTVQLACARNLSWQTIIDSTYGKSASRRIDGHVLPYQTVEALRTGNFNQVPVVLGYNLQEDRIGDYFSGNNASYYEEKYASNSSLEAAVKSYPLNSPCCNQSIDEAYSNVLSLYHNLNLEHWGIVSDSRTDSGNGLNNLLLAQYLQLHSSVYLYAFATKSPSPALYGFQAMHLLELMYVMNDTFFFDNHVMGAKELALAEGMSSAWATFAKTQVPGSVITSTDSWLPLNASGFATLYGPEKGKANVSGVSHWYYVDIEGGQSIEFRKETFKFFCNWKGKMGPAPPNVEPAKPVIFS